MKLLNNNITPNKVYDLAAKLAGKNIWVMDIFDNLKLDESGLNIINFINQLNQKDLTEAYLKLLNLKNKNNVK